MAKKATKRKVTKRVKKHPKRNIQTQPPQMTDKEPTDLERILGRLEYESGRAINLSLDINNKLHHIKNNEPDGKDKAVSVAHNDDWLGKIHGFLDKLSEANTINEKNNYKLNQLI